METWNRNNRACTTTWTTLRLLHQTIEKLETAGLITMENLAFWNSTSSPEFRKIQAQTLSFQMDNVFRMVRKATYETGTTQEKAINDILKILLDKEKTIADLAAANDHHYLFWGENDEW